MKTKDKKCPPMNKHGVRCAIDLRDTCHMDPDVPLNKSVDRRLHSNCSGCEKITDVGLCKFIVTPRVHKFPCTFR